MLCKNFSRYLKKMPPKNFKTLPKEEQRNFLLNIDTILTDCDGVLWLGGEAIDGATDVINLFQKFNRTVVYISNNSTKTIPQYCEKFNKMGFVASEDNIIVTAPLSAKYVSQNMDKSKKVYVIGTPAIISELRDVGIHGFGVGPEPVITNLSESEELEKIKLEDNVGAVVIGYDEHFGYVKMLKAASYLKNPDCLFVATNRDNQFPVKNKNYTLPGTGTLVATLEYCMSKEAVGIGKPDAYVIEHVKQMYSLDPKRTLMIGDRCNSDILFGNRGGFTTLFVLTGTHSLEDVERFEKSSNINDQQSVPEYYIDSIADLYPTMLEVFKS